MKDNYYLHKSIGAISKAGLLVLALFFQNSAAIGQIVPTEGMVECFLGGNGGLFQDIGGAADYPNCDCVSTTTICAVDGSAITIDFTSFGVNGAFDWLVILDTDNSLGEVYPAGAQLFNNSDGVGDGGADNYGQGADEDVNTLADMSSTSFTATNSSGCLTFVFRSSAVVAGSGWDAAITTSTNADHPGDNLDCLTNVDCLPPNGIAVDGVSFSSADVSWMASDSAMSYNVQYGASGFALGGGIIENTVNAMYTIGGLQENTSYDFYVEIDCGDGETSNYVGPFSFTTTFANPPDTCFYTLELFDSFGDGWNGSILTVTVNGLATDYTIDDGDQAIYTVAGLSNFPMVFTYTAGAFQNEVTYNILDPAGVIIFSDGPFPQTGEVLSIFACPTCPGPLELFVDEVGGLDAEISWLPSDSSGLYLVEYGPAGFTLGAGTMFTTGNTSATLNGLTENTPYDFYVTVACDNGDTSAMVGPETFQTIWLIDVGIIAVLAPQTQCGLSASETVEVTIQNFGDLPQSLIPFKYSVNNVNAGVSIPTDGFYTGVISNDSTVTIEFETTFDMSEPGEYTIMAWTCLEGDSGIFNDTTSFTVTNIPIVSEFPYFINFESWDGGWKLDEETSENATWDFGEPSGAIITAAASGLNAWVTNLTGNYNNSELSYVVSPCFDFTGLAEDPIINFSINFDTETSFDGGWLEGSVDGGMTWEKVGAMGTGVNWYTVDNTSQQLGPVWGGNSGGWIVAEHTLNGFSGVSDARFRFAFDSDSSVNGFDGFGIDDILISPIFSDDLSMLSVDHETLSECGDEEDHVVVEIRNAGSDGQFGFNVSYRINGGDVVTENVGALVINPGLSASYTFTEPFDSKSFGAAFDIMAWTELATELNFVNDTADFVFTTVTPMPLPLVEDFESMAIPSGWTSTDFVSPAHNNVSYVSAANLYSGNPDFQLLSPNIGPINAGDSLTFDYRYTDWSPGTEATVLGDGDSLQVQVSTDCGDSFVTVFTINSSNHTPVVSMTNRLVDLDGFGGEVIQIRFVGYWGSGDYWLDIDNINIIGCPQTFALDVQTIFETSTGAANGSIMINPTQGQGPYDIMWDDPNAPNDLEAGMYTVTVTDANGCEEIQTIEVGTCPDNLGLSSEVSAVSVEGESDGKITVEALNGEGPYTYQWDTGDSTAVVANLPVGEYTVTVIDVHGCSDELSVVIDLFVGAEDLESKVEINLAPNPTSGVSTLNIELGEVADLQVELVNIMGQVLLSRTQENAMSARYPLDLNDFATGVYFIRVRANGRLFIEKLVRVR